MDDAPSFAKCDLLVNIGVPVWELPKASVTVYRHKGLLIDGTVPQPQAMVHLRSGSGEADGYAASSAEVCKSAHNAGPGQRSFDERSYKLNTFTVESFKYLGKSGNKFVDQLASSLAGVAYNGNQVRKRVGTGRLQHFICHDADGYLSRGLERYCLALGWRRKGRLHANKFLPPGDRGAMWLVAPLNHQSGVRLWKYCRYVTCFFLLPSLCN